MSTVLRVLFGLPVATLLPLSVARLRNNRAVTLIISLVYAIYILYPAPSSPLLWATAFLTPVCTLGLRSVVNKLEGPAPVARTSESWKTRILRSLPLLVPLIITLIAETQLRITSFTSRIMAYVKNDDLSIMISGFLATVFIGGLLVGYIVRPLASQAAASEVQEQGPARLLETGSRVGWIERALFFVFFVGGAPDAATLALAAKAFVRAPEAGAVDAKSEYYLVGSLASVLVALGVSVAVRLALGRSAV